MSFEEQLQKGLFSSTQEKTYIDKLLGRREIERVKELVKKEDLSRSELLELLYMCLSAESKLVNLSEWDRYILLKFFVWIREFIKIAELMFDYESRISERFNEGKATLSDRTKRLFSNNKKLMEHNAKFLIDLYFNIARTSLSVKGVGFFELLKNKFEMLYQQTAQTIAPEKPKLWGGKNKGGAQSA